MRKRRLPRIATPQDRRRRAWEDLTPTMRRALLLIWRTRVIDQVDLAAAGVRLPSLDGLANKRIARRTIASHDGVVGRFWSLTTLGLSIASENRARRRLADILQVGVSPLTSELQL